MQGTTQDTGLKQVYKLKEWNYGDIEVKRHKGDRDKSREKAHSSCVVEVKHEKPKSLNIDLTSVSVIQPNLYDITPNISSQIHRRHKKRDMCYSSANSNSILPIYFSCETQTKIFNPQDPKNSFIQLKIPRHRAHPKTKPEPVPLPHHLKCKSAFAHPHNQRPPPALLQKRKIPPPKIP